MAVHILNDTPLALAFMAGRVRERSLHATVMVKGAFALANGDAAAAMERPLFHGDAQWDDEPAASCGYASDFAPFKPRTDVTLVGTCHAAGKSNATTASVKLGIGGLEKTLVVFGDRHWGGTDGRVASEPQPFSSLPLRYEHAFGGEGHAANPAGKGLGGALPNVELPDRLVTSPDDRPAPAGFGPIDARWSQRAGKLGTYDRRWLVEQWPYFPDDIDWGYFNAAPADQQLPYLRGDEPLYVAGMHPEIARFETQLPGVRPRCFLRRSDREAIEEVALNLDTVAVDMDAGTLTLVWRGLVEVASREAEEIEQALLVSEALAETARPAEEYHADAWWQSAQTSEEDLATIEEAKARAAAPEPPPEAPAAEEPDPEMLKQLDAWREELASAKVEPALLERLTGVTTPAAFAQILTAHMEELAEKAKQDAEGDSDADGSEEEPLDPNSLEGMREELRKADVDAAILERLEDAKTAAGFLAIVVDAFPEPKSAEEAAQREELKKSCAAMAEQQMNAALVEETKPRAARGERLTREELVALLAAGASVAESNLSELDLSGLDLQGVNLTSAKLDGANLAACNLGGADLSGATLRGAKLEGASLIDVVATGAAFEEALAAGVDLSRANLAHGNWSKADLRGATLEEVDLSGANLTLATLDRAELTAARLHGACLDGATLVAAKAPRATLRSASLVDVDLSDALLDDATLSEAKLERVDLSRASLCRAHLESVRAVDVTLSEAVLRNARLGGASFDGGTFEKIVADEANWMGASLRAANFAGASLERAIFAGAELAKASFKRARMQQADLRKADLSGAVLTQVNLFQGRLGAADLSGADCRASNLFGCDLFEAVTDGARWQDADLGQTCILARGLVG